MNIKVGKKWEKKKEEEVTDQKPKSLPYYKTHIHIQHYNCLQLLQVFFPYIQLCKHKGTQEKFTFRKGNSKIS